MLEDTIAGALDSGYLKPILLALMTAAARFLGHGLSQLTIDGHLPDGEAEPRLAQAVVTLLLEGSVADHTQQHKE